MPKAKAITLAPDALDRNGLSTTETLVATRLDYLINGAFAVASSYVTDSIVASAVPVAGTAMTIADHNYEDRKGAYILIDSSGSGDETGGTFVIVGKEPVTGNSITETITGPDANLIVLGTTRFAQVTSVTPAGTLSGSAITVGVNGYATFTTPQHMSAYSAGDDSGETVTFLGEDRYDESLTETITGAGAGATVDTTKNYKRVDRITASGVGAGATEAGNDGLCESQWYVINYRGNNFSVGLGLDIVSGTLTCAVQHTFNNVQGKGFREDDATVHTHDTITGKTADFDGNYSNPPVACRLAITAFTSGSATLRIVQAGSGT
jgi:hypothetical protein